METKPEPPKSRRIRHSLECLTNAVLDVMTYVWKGGKGCHLSNSKRKTPGIHIKMCYSRKRSRKNGRIGSDSIPCSPVRCSWRILIGDLGHSTIIFHTYSRRRSQRMFEDMDSWAWPVDSLMRRTMRSSHAAHRCVLEPTPGAPAKAKPEGPFPSTFLEYR